MELISLIMTFIVAIIIKEIKKSNEDAERVERRSKANYQMPKQATRVKSARVQVQQENERWKQAAQENIERARRRAEEKRPAMNQGYAGRMETKKPAILQRAVGNAEENKEDVTLHTMEAEHNHSERVSAAVHHHPEDVLPENMLGTVEDLMVKGYGGNLCFERDFVGEAMDMINRFNAPSEIPDFTNEYMA